MIALSLMTCVVEKHQLQSLREEKEAPSCRPHDRVRGVSVWYLLRLDLSSCSSGVPGKTVTVWGSTTKPIEQRRWPYMAPVKLLGTD